MRTTPAASPTGPGRDRRSRGLSLDYLPSPTIRAFLLSEALVKCVVGPLGSGKSMGCIIELFRRMCEQAPDVRGIRPTRFAVVRNTFAQIRDTTLADITEYFGQYFTYKASASTIQWDFHLPDKTRVRSDWLLMPLERPEDSRKLLSLNLTGAWVEECREVEYSIVAALRGRIGRFPAPVRVRPTWQGLIMSSNPWSEGSEYYQHFIVAKPDSWDLFRQPGGLEPEAENIENLPDGYYDRLMYGASKEFIKVHVHGLWGDDLFGRAVFQASFKPDWHLARDLSHTLNVLRPVLVGIDFGRQPAAIITQEEVMGTILALEEVLATDQGFVGFLEEVLLPVLQQRYSACRVFIVGDPAGVARSGLREESAFSLLEDHGLAAIPAPTNDVLPRLQAVEKLLLRSIAGRPGLLVDRGRCPVLAEGFLRGYRYKKRRDGSLTPEPDKNEFSHPHDGLQYAALGHQSSFVGRRIEFRAGFGNVRRRPKFSARAWT